MGKSSNELIYLFIVENILQGKSGCIEKAKEIFNSLVEPNTIAYAAMSK